MKRQDNILKKFIVLLVVTLCVFGLFTGAVVAYRNTEKQLNDTGGNIINETDIIEYFSEKIYPVK